MYPWCNKKHKHPIGHPEIITENFKEINPATRVYEGMILLDILPPRKLLLPLLPCKINKKTMFVLCRTCAENVQKTECQHTDEERMLHGVYVTDEVYKALELGYKIIRVYEVWHYKETRTDLFAGYVNKFLKMKAVSIFFSLNLTYHP